jgi:phosphoribosylamine--glycine ligase
MESDLLEVMQAVSEERLADVEVKFSTGAACCVVHASKGYPEKYDSGFEITEDDLGDAFVYYAGAKVADGKIVTSGGRVLGVVAKGEKLEDAIANAYEASKKVHFDNDFYRNDIGQRALQALKK